MSLPDAAAARRTVEHGQYEKALVQLQLITQTILNAIKDGQTTVSIENSLEPPVKKSLEAKGYKVNTSSARNETYTSISW